MTRLGAVLIVWSLVLLGGCPSHTTKRSRSLVTPSIHLEQSGHGFLVPVGWANTLPLRNYGGPASFAEYRAPSTSSVIVFEENGGSFGFAYTPKHEPRPLLLLLTKDDPRFSCSVEAHEVISASRVLYQCKGEIPGLITEGVIVVLPYPGGYDILQATVPSQDRSTANCILSSLAG